MLAWLFVFGYNILSSGVSKESIPVVRAYLEPRNTTTLKRGAPVFWVPYPKTLRPETEMKVWNDE